MVHHQGFFQPVFQTPMSGSIHGAIRPPAHAPPGTIPPAPLISPIQENFSDPQNQLTQCHPPRYIAAPPTFHYNPINHYSPPDTQTQLIPWQQSTLGMGAVPPPPPPYPSNSLPPPQYAPLPAFSEDNLCEACHSAPRRSSRRGKTRVDMWVLVLIILNVIVWSLVILGYWSAWKAGVLCEGGPGTCIRPLDSVRQTFAESWIGDLEALSLTYGV